ncbi:MAG: hypothetical protein J6X86_05500 [Bacteroidales bacterium]|nr:hypothetical protein [Bacteroidales bacterium]
MNNDKLIKLSSITKKLLVAILGSFLLLFLLFHMTANLFILYNDGGNAYSAFCHFMGTNIFVKIMELILLGSLLLHMCLASYLWYTNRRNRPVPYHRPNRTKTAPGSKLAMITGSLILVCLLFHFYDFFFVKVNIVKGTYMVKTEELSKTKELENELMKADQGTLDAFMWYFEATESDNEGMLSEMSVPDELKKEVENNAQLAAAVHTAWYITKSLDSDRISSDHKWLRKIDASQKEEMEQFFPEAEFEPDFYNMARQKFSVWHVVLCYLLFIALVGIHVRHGFESAFQTFGLNHYKYSRIIEVLAIIYCWVICVGFAIVPLGVLLVL